MDPLLAEHEWRYIEKSINPTKFRGLTVITDRKKSYVFYSKTLKAENMRHSEMMRNLIEKAKSSFMIRWTGLPDNIDKEVYWR